MIKIWLSEICYFEAQGNYISIYTLTATHKTYLTISELEEKLSGSLFVRVHRSFIISLAQVKSFTNTYINIDHKQIPIGRSYRLKTISVLGHGRAFSQ
jgi:DNA-binding LytR/AlgR family response regulator